MNRARELVGVIASLIVLFSPASRAEVLSLRTYGIEDGLAQSVVTAMLQDAKGYLWLGTQDGLSRFDGVEFRTFDQRDGLGSSSITALLEDAERRLLVGTHGGLFRRSERGFERVDLAGSPKDRDIVSLLRGRDGSAFAVGESGQIFALQGARAVVRRRGGLSSPASAAALDARGVFWIATLGAGIARVSGQEIAWLTTAQGLPEDRVLSLAIDREDRLWVGTGEHGLARCERGRCVPLTPRDLPGPAVQSILPQGGELWLATNKGACRMKEGACRSITAQNGLPVGAVTTILRDVEGMIWFGTYGGGVSLLLTEAFVHYTRQSGLESLVYGIAETSDHAIVLGTDENGVYQVRDRAVSPWKEVSEATGGTVYAIRRDRRGDLWFSTYGRGVVRARGEAIERMGGAAAGGRNRVNDIHEAADGTIWIATGRGWARVSGSELSFSPEGEKLNESIAALASDAEGALWLGTAGRGAFRLHQGKLVHYTKERGLAGDRINSMFLDRARDLWIATNEGLTRWRAGQLKSFTTADGLSNNTCYFVIQDDRGALWIGTNRGLNRFDGARFKTLTTRDGLVTNEFNSGAFKDSRGHLWFGHIKGVTMYAPELDVAHPSTPPIDLTEVAVLEEPVALDAAASLPHHRNRLTFRFSAPSFRAPTETRFRYQIEELDPAWHSSTDRVVRYASVPPGRYTFRVVAESRDGVRSPAPATFSFRVLPPFWQTTWFLAAVVLLLLAAAYGLYRWRVRATLEENRRLEATIRDRTRELQVEKDKSEDLLCNILPRELVAELRDRGGTAPRRFDNATILFTDFKGFTNTSATMPADFLVGELNDIFVRFDAIIREHGLEKIKTVGDAYLIAGGLPRESDDHAVRCIRAALDMQRALAERNETSAVKWRMRAGIHSGTVVAGVVGKHKFTYDVWGDTVNMASRMETACEPGRVNISAFTYHLAREEIEATYRGKIDIKGKGEVDMYFVDGMKEKVS